jgi:hypothetical protein
MSNRTFTKAELNGMTGKALKRMCIDELGIVGTSKLWKEEVIKKILKTHGPGKYGSTITKTAAVAKKEPIKGIDFSGHSVITKPGNAFGQKTSTTIQVSCGASSGAFPVAGRTVKEVGEFLREVLNVDQLSTGLVNGKEAAADYQLKPGDALEFLKPAGKKG